MKVRITFKDYVNAIRQYSNLPLDIEMLAKPFGVFESSEASGDLLVGHLLDAMDEEFEDTDLVDALDAATTALSLGYEAAAGFLDRGPMLIMQAQELPKELL